MMVWVRQKIDASINKYKHRNTYTLNLTLKIKYKQIHKKSHTHIQIKHMHNTQTHSQSSTHTHTNTHTQTNTHIIPHTLSGNADGCEWGRAWRELVQSERKRSEAKAQTFHFYHFYDSNLHFY